MLSARQLPDECHLLTAEYGESSSFPLALKPSLSRMERKSPSKSPSMHFSSVTLRAFRDASFGLTVVRLSFVPRPSFGRFRYRAAFRLCR